MRSSGSNSSEVEISMLKSEKKDDLGIGVGLGW